MKRKILNDTQTCSSVMHSKWSKEVQLTSVCPAIVDVVVWLSTVCRQVRRIRIRKWVHDRAKKVFVSLPGFDCQKLLMSKQSIPKKIWWEFPVPFSSTFTMLNIWLQLPIYSKRMRNMLITAHLLLITCVPILHLWSIFRHFFPKIAMTHLSAVNSEYNKG